MNKKKEISAKHFRAGTKKVIEMNKWESEGLIKVDPDTDRAIVHYLIWHLWSNKGLVKFCNSLYFFTNIKKAMDVSNAFPSESTKDLTIYVDYTGEPNDYGRNGLVEMVKFNPFSGFSEV